MDEERTPKRTVRPPGGLPRRLTAFVGRTRELADVRRLMGMHRLVTLTGSGGCGKTRLALEVARAAEGDFVDGVYWADLSGATNDDGVSRAVADSLDVQGSSSRPYVDTITIALRTAEALCVLDNCEHVIEGCAALVSALLDRCPSLVVMTTSRTPLRVEGEVLYRVPSLSFPEEPTEPDDVLTFDAVKLFVERAKRIRPDFEVSGDAASVAAICRRLDGVPLALELAAARLRVRSPAQIAAGLDDRFRLLTRTAYGAVPRQRTLEASIAWSYELLGEEERTLFRRLAVFSGAFSLDAVDAVSDAGDGRALDLLTELIEHSLVEVEESATGARYRFLETIRAFAASRLELDETELIAARGRHLSYFRSLLEGAEYGLASADVFTWLDRQSLERDNVITALDWAQEIDDADSVAAIASSSYWNLRERAHEPRAALSWALGRPELSAELEARATLAAARLALDQWDLAATREAALEALELSTQVGDEVVEARARVILATASLWIGASGEASEALETARTIATQSKDAGALAQTLCALGQVPFASGEMTAALALFDEAIDAARRSGEVRTRVESLNYAFMIAWLGGDDARAQGICDEGLDIAERGRSPVAGALFNSFASALETRRGAFDAARASLGRAREFADLSDHPVTHGQWVHHSAFLARAEGDLELARARFDEGLALAQALRVPIAVITTAPHAAEARSLLGDIEGAAAIAETASPWRQEMKLTPGTLSWLDGLLAFARDDLPAAVEHAHDALSQALAFPARQYALEALELLGCCYARTGDLTESARLLGAAETGWRTQGWVRPATLRDRFAQAVVAAREALGESEFERLYEQGELLSLDEAAAYVQRGRGARNRPVAGWASLTPTELSVAELVADGLSNADIAARLFVTLATVKSHLTHVYAKLGITSRVQLAKAFTERT